MNDQPKAPLPAPEADPRLDRVLTGLPRFAPLPGFAERVLSRVWIPLPPWARTLRAWLLSYVTGVRGWVILGSLSVATAASWATAIGLGLAYREELAYGLNLMGPTVAVPGWQDLTTLAAAALEAVGAGFTGWIDGLGVPVGFLVGTYAAVTLVSAVALWRLTAEPAGARLTR